MQIGFCSPRSLRAPVWARVVLVTAVLSLGTGGIAVAAKQSHKSGKHPTAGHGGLSVSKAPWGTANGKAVDLYTLRNGHGMIVKITNYGGVVQSIWVPDSTGALKNVALGFPKLSDYVNDFQNQPWPAAGGSGDTYFGGIIGRYANRIANHSFTLDGTTYQLPGNNGPNNVNTLHGGPDAYNTQVSAATPEKLANAVALKLTYTDPNGKNGLPGSGQHRGHLHAHARQRVCDYLPRDHDRADGRRLHQPHLFQPGRRGIGERVRPEAGH